MEEFQRHLRVAGRLSKNLRKLIYLCNAVWKLEEGMAPTSRLDAGRKARLFDMKRPVVHTRNNYFFKSEHRFFFFFIYLTLLVMHTSKMPNQIFDFFYNALKNFPVNHFRSRECSKLHCVSESPTLNISTESMPLYPTGVSWIRHRCMPASWPF